MEAGLPRPKSGLITTPVLCSRRPQALPTYSARKCPVGPEIRYSSELDFPSCNFPATIVLYLFIPLQRGVHKYGTVWRTDNNLGKLVVSTE